jgi:DHA1 family inner membrane transport protein
MPLALLALAVASFCIGTTEFVIMGLLPDVASDLGVTIPIAGLLVTGYALGVVFGAPIVAALVIKLPRKPALLGMVGVFVLGNMLCAIAPNYTILLLARIVTAFCHGSFFGIGSVVAADLVAPNRRASAIAMMFAGLTLANVLGVPFGTALGNALGWRSTFWAVAVVGVIAAVAIALWLPANIPLKPADLRGEMRVLKQPQVLLAMGISVLCSACLFTVFTYITPLLETVTGLSPSAVTYALLIFGAGLTCGNFIGGRLADWRLMPSLLGVIATLLVMFVVIAAVSRSPLAMFGALFVWGAISFAVVAPLQLRIVNEAAAAPNLASTLNQGAFNLGNATGAWLGGAALIAGVSYAQLPWISAALSVVAIAAVVVSMRLPEPGRARSAA